MIEKIDKRDVLKEMIKVNKTSLVEVSYITKINFHTLSNISRKNATITLATARKLPLFFKDTDAHFWLRTDYTKVE